MASGADRVVNPVYEYLEPTPESAAKVWRAYCNEMMRRKLMGRDEGLDLIMLTRRMFPNTVDVLEFREALQEIMEVIDILVDVKWLERPAGKSRYYFTPRGDELKGRHQFDYDLIEHIKADLTP